MEKEMKTLPELVEELVEAMYELEKVKYSRPERRHGWVSASYLLAYGLESGLGKRQIAARLQKNIDEAKQEMSDLCDKVEL
jgi:hypothetical protein